MARQVISKILLPAAVVAECLDMKACKRSDLPIYMPEQKEEGKKKGMQQELLQERNIIEETIGTVRKTLFSMVSEVKSFEEKGINYLYEGVNNAQWLVNYLGDESNPAPKMPAIAIGGLTGFIFGLRGGFFRKIIFTSTGALGMAAVCYPKEAAEYSEIAFTESKQYATIAYNFVYGVKKDDPPLELPSLPNMPGSISEAWSLISSLGKSEPSSITVEVSREDQVENMDESLTDVSLSSSNFSESSELVSQVHVEATNKKCHCPIGACLTHDEETNPAVLPYPPPVPPPTIIEPPPVCPPCPEV